MASLGDLTVGIGVDLNTLKSGLSSAKGLLGGFAVAAVAGLAGFGVASVKAAGDFQQSMLKVQAYAGLSNDQIKGMNSTIMQMATSLGQSPKAIADALYPLISSGYTASQALDMLTLSGKTAAASGADMAVVADALSTSLKAMHAPASQASIYMDDINKMVSLGKGEVPQYAAVIGKLALAAGSAKVPFADMGAALATLTTHGFPSVAQASTSLGNLFTQVGPKVDTLTQHAQKLGLSFNENKFKTLDFADKLNYLNTVTKGNQGEILKLVGGNTLALKAFNALTGSTKDFTSNLKAMGDATGTTDSVFETASSGWNASVSRVNAAIQVLMVSVGSALLPALTGIANQVTPLISGFADWVGKSDMLSGSVSTLSTLLGQAGGVIRTVASDIGIFVQGIIGAINQSGALQSVLQTVQDTLPAVGNFITGLGSDLDNNLLPPLASLITNVGITIKNFSDWLDKSGTLRASLDFLSGTLTTITSIVGGLIGYVSSLVNWFNQGGPDVDLFKDAINLLANALLALGVWKVTQQLIDFGTKAYEATLKVIDLADKLSGQAVNAFNLFVNGAQGASVAEGEVGTAASTMATEVQAGAVEAEASIEQIGVQATATATQVAASSTEMGTSLSQVGTQATATAGESTAALGGVGTAIGGVGTAVVAGGGLILGGLIAISVAFMNWQNQMISDAGTWTANWIINWAGWGDSTSKTTENTKNKVSKSASDMNTNVSNSFNTMKNNGLQATSLLSSGAINLFAKMGADGEQMLANLSASSYAYWNNVADVINRINTAAPSNIPKNLPSGIVNKNFYASGVTNAPAGLAVVGEDGPELVQFRGGENVFPTGTGPSFSSGGGGVEVHNHIYIDGRRVTDQIMTRAMTQMRAKTGYRAA